MMIDMTEDHRVVSTTERARIARMGYSLKDGEKRLNGMVFCLICIAKYFSPSDLPRENQIIARYYFNRTKPCQNVRR
jgi:protein phosphatase